MSDSDADQTSSTFNPSGITVVLIHHALGLTEGIEDMAADMARAGFATVAPDLFDGKVFSNLDEGVAYARNLGVSGAGEKVRQVIAEVGRPLVFMGVSFGAIVAQSLAQTDDRCIGGALLSGVEDPTGFEQPWPFTVGAQLHLVTGDRWVDPDAVDAFSDNVARVTRFDYDSVGHLFMDPTVPSDYDESARNLMMTRLVSMCSDLSAGTGD